MAKKRISQITNTGTDAEFVQGNYLPIDGNEGSKKMPLNLFTPKSFADAVSGSIAPDYSELTFPVSKDTLCMHGGSLFICSVIGGISTQEDWTPAHWTEVTSAEIIANLESMLGIVKNGGALTDGASVNVPNNSLSTLTSSQAALTLNVACAENEVPNFAVEITAGAAITLTVTKTVGSTTTTLKYAEAAGNTLESGKFYQVTCVGNCWTLAEFTQPTP